MKIDDLFCGAGGASKGLHDAGFEVVGFDINPQPNYPYEFYKMNALDADLTEFDAVWASPPCQAFSQAVKKIHRGNHENYIPAIREMLMLSELPYIIENVPTAKIHLKEPITLCGSSFGLPVRRHRLFESNVALKGLECRHNDFPPKYPPAWNRKNLLRVISISGGYQGNGVTFQEKLDAMGVDWSMTIKELSEAIPPAYSKFLGKKLMSYLNFKGE